VATRDEFATCMALLSGGIGRPMSEEQASTWFLILGDVPAEPLQAAVLRWLRETESGFFPPAATILRMVVEHSDGRLLSADEAFTQFLAAKRRFDPFRQAVQFMGALNPLVRQTVLACGGPRWAADLLTEDRQIYAGQFRKAYETIAAREDRQRRLPESLRPRIAANQTPNDGPQRLPVHQALLRIAGPGAGNGAESAA
jgi:hypothetical protein